MHYVVVGIGINVNQASFAGELNRLRHRCAWRAGAPGRASNWRRLAKSLDSEYRKLTQGGPGARSSILRRFEERSSYARSRQVHVEASGGGYDGVTEGLDDRGFLLVRTESGVRTVLSGDVRALSGK